MSIENLLKVKVKIGGWNETSLVDVIDNISFTIWFNYCNFKCPWCSNSHIVSGEISREITIKEIIEKIKQSQFLIDFVHITGGEPTLQENALHALLKCTKEFLKIPTSLSTNASLFNTIKKISPLLDHIAIDIKAPLSKPQKYAKVVGLTPTVMEQYLKNITKTVEFSIKNLKFVELRTTIIPNLINKQDIQEIANNLKPLIKESKGRVVYVIQQFIPYKTIANEEYRKKPPTPERTLIEYAKIIEEELQIETYIRSLSKGTTKIK